MSWRLIIISFLAIVTLFSASVIFASSPGDLVGYTSYDMQTNGSTGTRIVVDSLGGVHICWMRSINTLTPRYVYYNYADQSGNWLAPNSGVQVNAGTGAGYCQIGGTTSFNSLIAYHQTSLNYLNLAAENAPGSGVFNIFDIPDTIPGLPRFTWPYMAIDRSGRIQMIASDQPPSGNAIIMAYTRSSDNGATWSSIVRVDTLMNVSGMITASPVSDRMAIVYTHPINTQYSTKNDVYYVISEDGSAWDFANGKINITDYVHNPDSNRAYEDLDAIFDYNDNLHIVWNTNRIPYPGNSVSVNASWLWHYSENTGSINLITENVYSHGNEYPCVPDLGFLESLIPKVSIATDDSNHLFAVWTGYDSTDYSIEEVCNGEILMSYSIDQTAWAVPVNITNSRTPGCASGECDSDNWSSLAERVDDFLYLTYIEDKFSGALNYNNLTLNPIRYLAYPNPSRGAPDISVAPETVNVSIRSGETQLFPAAFSVSNNGSGLLYLHLSSEDWIGLNVHEDTLLPGESVSVDLEVDATEMSPGTRTTTIQILSNDPLRPNLFSPFISVDVLPPSCSYTPGDANGNDVFNGIDVVYSVNYLKGAGPLPPDNCDCPGHGILRVAADANGNCVFNGIDVSYSVNYLKGMGPAPSGCVDCPPAAN